MSDDELIERVESLRRENDEREAVERKSRRDEVRAAAKLEPSQSTDGMIDWLLDNLDRFPREKLTADLVGAGHNPEDVEAVWTGFGVVEAAKVFSNGPDVLVRAYPGRRPEEATAFYEREAPLAATFGYIPTSQSWAEGKIGVGRVILIGFYSLMFKPKGYLTVTYVKGAGSVAAPDGDTKVCPQCAEEVRQAARICRFCGYEFT